MKRKLLFGGAALIALLVIGVMFAATCDRLATATLPVQNDTNESVTISVSDGAEKPISPHSTVVLSLGYIFGRWGAPGTVLISTQGGRKVYECVWDDIKSRSRLIVKEDGPNCRDIFPRLPPPITSSTRN